MKKNFKKVIIALLVVLLLYSCSCISEGTVIEKSHKDASVYTTYLYINGQFVPQVHSSPERWYLTLQNHDTGEKGTVAVDSYVWHEIQVGDYYKKD